MERTSPTPEQIRALMVKHNLSAYKFAELCGHNSRSSVSKWLSGHHPMSYLTWRGVNAVCQDLTEND